MAPIAPPVALPLLPPRVAGQTASLVRGCLSAPGDEAAAARHVSRGPAAPDTVRVAGDGSGVHVVHALSHACCLKAEVESALEEQTVRVRERLLGQACRCRCASEIESAVRVPPGEWRVVVETESAGQARVVHEQRVRVGALGSL